MIHWMADKDVRFNMADKMFLLDSEAENVGIIQSPTSLSKGDQSYMYIYMTNEFQPALEFLQSIATYTMHNVKKSYVSCVF